MLQAPCMQPALKPKFVPMHAMSMEQPGHMTMHNIICVHVGLGVWGTDYGRNNTYRDSITNLQ